MIEHLDSKLQNRVGLVTGASRGLGKGIALRLAQSGAAVVVNYARDRTGAEAVVELIESSGGAAFAVQADVANAAAVAAMFADVETRFGRCDIIVANAGVAERATVFDLSLADWNRVFGVQLKGVFLCVKAAIPLMQRNGWGRVVTISSDAGKRGGKVTGPHYSASKAGVLGLMMGLSRQLASLNITVNDVSPMDIPTERWANRSQGELDTILKGIPRGKFGTPADIGNAVAFLATEEAAHITGVSIDVSGGGMLQ